MHPLHPSSPYMKHYNYENKIVLVKRDCRTNNKRPWGIYFCYDYSGGACCVASISPCSPAETAVDLGSGKILKIPIGRSILIFSMEVMLQVT